MLSPRELKRGVFNKTFKGYSEREVDEYVRFLLSKYTEAYNEYIELEAKYALAMQELDGVKSEENAISTTIVNAQKMADAIVSDAKKKAAEITGAVSETCDMILDAYMTKVTAERDKLEKCEAAVNDFKASLINAYKKHLDLIYDIMPDEEPTPRLSDEELEEKAVEIANEKIADVLGVPASQDNASEAEEAVTASEESAENEVIAEEENA